MVDEHLIAQRLAAIRDHVARIDSCLPSEREQFLTDRNSQEIVSFNLFLAFQDALALASHVIADRNLELPTTARATSRFSSALEFSRPVWRAPWDSVRACAI